MKNRRGLACVLGAVVAVILGTMAIQPWRNIPTWPHFPESKAVSAPQFEIEYEGDRDYGYRTGNHIPVTVYLKVPAGQHVDLNSMAVKGDFVLAEKDIYRQKGDAGVEYIRMQLKLQAFVYNPKWTGSVHLAYRTAEGEERKLEAGPIEVFSSRTFDERKSKHPKDPVLSYVPHYSHMALTAVLFVVGLGGTIGTIVFLVRTSPIRQKTLARRRAAEARARELCGPVDTRTAAEKAWDNIAVSGDHSVEAVGAFADALRDQEKLGPRSVEELRASATDRNVVLADVLGECRLTTWALQPFGAEQVTRVGELLAKLKKSDEAAKPAKKVHPRWKFWHWRIWRFEVW